MKGNLAEDVFGPPNTTTIDGIGPERRAVDPWSPILPVPEGAPELAQAVIDRLAPRGYTFTQAWPYRDATGRLLGYTVRYDCVLEGDGACGSDKQVRPFTFCEGQQGRREWRAKAFTAPRPLFGLDELAKRPIAHVIIMEGEKCAVAGRAVFPFSVVVTSPGGCNAADKADWTRLKGRNVLIWPDADKAGLTYANIVATKLAGIAAKVEIVDAMALASRGLEGEEREPPKSWDVAAALEEGWSPSQLYTHVCDPTSGLIHAAVGSVATGEDKADETIVAPDVGYGGAPAYVSTDPFRMGPRGLFVDAGSENGSEWICSPFEVLAATRDDASASWGTMLRWADPDGHVHTRAMPWALLHSDGTTLCQALAERGLRIAPTVSARKRLLTYLATAEPKRRMVCVARTGWHERNGRAVFVLPEGTIGGETGNEEVVLQTASHAPRSPFEAQGKLENWQEAIARLCVGNSRLTFALCTALAGPLLYVTGAESGGFNFYGESTSGKTTAMQVAASVFGRGTKGGFVGTWRGTDNGLEQIAALHSDTLLILDELGQTSAKIVGETAYMLAQETGKTRMSRTGELRATARWRVMILSSGEMTIEAKIADEKTRKAAAGQLVRLLDLSADAGQHLGVFDHVPEGFADAKVFADHLKVAAGRVYGTAGPAFIKAITEAPEDARDLIAKYQATWVTSHCPREAQGQVRRAADRFALVAAAGELAIACRILPWHEGTAAESAARLFADWIATRGGTGQAEVALGLAQVRRFLEQYGDSRFAPLNGESHFIPNRAGFRRHEVDSREWLILPEVWKGEVAAGFDSGVLAKALVARGMMKVGGDGKPQVKTALPSLGKVRVYIVTAKLFEEAAHA